MNFIYPQFLFGLLALLIPIIVHLFNFRRTKKISFSNNLFLRNAKKVSTSKLKLKHLLILAARLFFIFFLVIAFAQPFIPGIKESLKNDQVYIYLDNSLSMSNEVGIDLRAIDQGINFIDELVGIYPQNTKYKILTNEFASSADLMKSKDETRELLSEMGLTGVSRDLTEVNNRQLRDFLSDQNEKKDIYWLSDFQKSTTGNLSDIKFDTSANYSLVPLNYSNPLNIYIDTLYLTSPFLMANEKNELVVSLSNSGNEAIADIPVKLFINDTQIANTSVSIEANNKSTVTFELNRSLSKKNKGKISFEEFPVTFDNDFYFTLTVDDRVDLLEIRSGNTSKNIQKVFGNRNLFNLSSFEIENIDYSAIGKSDLIILNELNTIFPSLISVLQDFLDAGGTIVFIPGPQTDINAFSPLLPIRLKNNLQRQDKLDLNPPDLSNPFFSNIFIDSDEVFEMPQAVDFVQIFAPHETILSLKTKEPFLSELLGNNKIFIFSTPMLDTYTNFHKHAIFVPVMYRIASLSNVMSDELYHSLDKPLITLSIDSIFKNDIYKLKKNDQEVIPLQRSVGRELIIEIPKNTISEGYYDVVKNDETKKILSFNFDKKESVMEQYKESDLLNTFSELSNVKIYDSENNKDFTKALKELHSGVPLWKYMLIISLIALLAEILLIRFL